MYLPSIYTLCLSLTATLPHLTELQLILIVKDLYPKTLNLLLLYSKKSYPFPTTQKHLINYIKLFRSYILALLIQSTFNKKKITEIN